MKTKNSNPAELIKKPDANNLVKLYYQSNYLKRLFRQGWLVRKVPESQCETVAEHSFGVALLCMFITQAYFPDLSIEKIIKMALIHDFGEIHVGDITPYDKIDKKTKHEKEMESVKSIFFQDPFGKEYLDLWTEFEQGQTAEARLVKQIDILESAFQASIYELEYDKDIFNEFENYNRVNLTDKKLLYFLDELKVMIEAVKKNKK